MNELIKNFDDFMLDYPKMIRNNSCVALKHNATGKYLSSCNKKYHKSNYQVVRIYCIYCIFFYIIYNILINYTEIIYYFIYRIIVVILS